MESFLCRELQKSLGNSTVDMASEVLRICESYYDKPVHNLLQLRQRNTKRKGDIFELFCAKYMRVCYGLPRVWLFSQIPADIRQHLNLGTQDMGIDLVGQDADQNYYAIQSKYRKRNPNRKTGIGWKQLSTFYALASRSGPYLKHIVFTSADYARHIGKKSSQDQTLNFNSLLKITHFQWLEMAQINKVELPKELFNSSPQLTKAEVRAKRLLRFSSVQNEL